ncbi:hypothetical protein Q1695_004583 [Nippostrongylus brasiliensis]|nr:hypothetical protein Q1695_004583 [Nippostrongylus brasiliensis]
MLQAVIMQSPPPPAALVWLNCHRTFAVHVRFAANSASLRRHRDATARGRPAGRASRSLAVVTLLLAGLVWVESSGGSASADNDKDPHRSTSALPVQLISGRYPVGFYKPSNFSFVILVRSVINQSSQCSRTIGIRSTFHRRFLGESRRTSDGNSHNSKEDQYQID